MSQKTKQRKKWRGAKFTDPRRSNGEGAMKKIEPGVPVVIEAPSAQASGRREEPDFSKDRVVDAKGNEYRLIGTREA